jgi:hypothetical protein
MSWLRPSQDRLSFHHDAPEIQHKGFSSSLPELVAAVSALLTAGSSWQTRSSLTKSHTLMISDVRIGKAHGQEFADGG